MIDDSNCVRIFCKAFFRRLIHKSPKMHKDPGMLPIRMLVHSLVLLAEWSAHLITCDPKATRSSFLLGFTTLPKFNSSPLKSYRNPIGKDRLPTIIFRGKLLNFRGVRVGSNSNSFIPVTLLLSSSPLSSRNGHTQSRGMLKYRQIVYWLVYLNIIASKFGISSFSGCHHIRFHGCKTNLKFQRGYNSTTPLSMGFFYHIAP